MSGRVLGRSDIRQICIIVTGLNLNHTQYWWPMTALRHMTRFFCDSWASCVDRVTTVRLCNQVIIYRPNTVNCTDILQQLCCNTVVAEWTSSGRRTGRDAKVSRPGPVNSGILGPDLQNILRQCYDYLAIMKKLGPTIDLRRTSNLQNILYDYRKINLRQNAWKSYDPQLSSVRTKLSKLSKDNQQSHANRETLNVVVTDFVLNWLTIFLRQILARHKSLQ